MYYTMHNNRPNQQLWDYVQTETRVGADKAFSVHAL